MKKGNGKAESFTLIEMIGVMALLAILAAVVVPPLISRLETVDSAKEDANLEEIARALAEGIKATGTIPNPALAAGVSGSWTAIASNYTFLAPRLLATNFPARNARRIIFSVDLANFVAANGFVTPDTGWPDPLPAGDMRIYILASSKRNLPLLSGIPVSDIADWDKVYSNTGVIPVPATVFGATQTNKGEFLHVTSISVRPLFCRVELHEFPYPSAAVTQSANPGAGFTAGSTYTALVGSFSFSFVAPGADFGSGTPASSISLSGTKSQITRSSATTTTMTGTIGGGGSSATFNITAINHPPWWEISPPTAVVGQGMPPTANTKTFYVLKGTSLSLYPAGATFPSTPTLTAQINSDCRFEYFGGSWTRVD